MDGRCEETGFCSFPDEDCVSGHRYGQHAGELSYVCVPLPDEEPTSSTTSDITTTGPKEDESSEVATSLPASGASTSSDEGSTSALEGSTSDSSGGDETTGTPENCEVADFEDGSIPPAFNTWFDPGCTIGVSGGALVMTPPSGQVGYCGLNSSSGDFTMGTVSAHYSEVPSNQALLTIKDDSDGYAIAVGEDYLDVESIQNALWSTLYSSSDSFPTGVWLRIRTDGASTHFEVSDDGDDWFEFHSEPGLPPPQAHAEFVAGAVFPDPDPGTLEIEVVEICPLPSR